ncbi:hypothetical protein LTR29_007567 [Friedmanniomyces endolithicus]|nr:hypothetical protein LTR29_007567 [Friedmanniomyces endolithicus]
MADHRPTGMTRASSAESSALSNIDVAATVAGAEEDASDRVSNASTPPTSLADTGEMSTSSAKKVAGLEPVEKDGGRRPKRARAGPSSYNLKKLSDAQLPIGGTAASIRNVSGLTGRTLVNGEESGEQRQETPLEAKTEKALDREWAIPADVTPKELPARLQRKTSVKDRVKKAAGKVGTVLGKRTREVMEAGKRKLGRKRRDEHGEDENVEAEAEGEEEKEEDVPRWKKKLDMGPKGLLDELDLDAEPASLAPPPAKRAKRSGKAALQEMSQAPVASVPLAKAATASKHMKKWQKEGMFAGQDADFDPMQPGGQRKLQKKRPGSSMSDETTPAAATPTKRSFVTLPMFSYLDKTRDFVVPFDVFAPTFKKGDEKPKDWHQVNRNRLVGEAKEMWEKSERLPASMCVCQASEQGDLGCDDHCPNRVMQYECNDDNCNLSALQCGNRLFTDLAVRMKKGGAFDIGVEVLKTPDRGFGVRSCRTWAPGQIIMEYTGEIVSEGECQRRIREDYKDKQCYYLMELERGLIIDGTKGSMARFINHSCEPNCEVRMVKVNGTPRMGVFAGEGGVATGQELTYDYNFDNFGEKQQMCYCGAATCRGYLSKRLNAAEQKKMARVENEKKRKAAEEAQRHAEDEDRKKKVKTDRGSSWRGWVAVDDPETKERLKREKREREEAAKSSDRARRLAARRTSLPAAERETLIKKKSDAKRRKTVAVDEEAVRGAGQDDVEAQGDEEDVGDEPAVEQPTIRRGAKGHRASSSVSKFTEDLPRPASAHSTTTSTITRKTEITITEKAELEPTIPRPVTALDGTRDDDAEEEIAVAVKKQPIKDAMKSVGQAVKNGLLGAAGRSMGGVGNKKQTTLSFAKKMG